MTLFPVSDGRPSPARDLATGDPAASDWNDARGGLVAWSLLAVAMLIAWQVASKPLGAALIAEEAPRWAPFLFSKGVLCALLIFCLVATSARAATGIGRIGPLWTLVYGAPILALGALIALSPAATWPLDAAGAAAWASVALLVGFSEEVVFRGYVQGAFGRRLWIGAIVSSLGFGAVHLLGLASAIPAEIILAQCAFAFSFGLVFAAVRIASGGLWLPILLHFGFDAAAFIALGGPSDALSAGDAPERRLLSMAAIVTLIALPILFLAVRRARRPEKRAMEG